MHIRSPFWQGFFDGLPFIVIIVPFSMLFGVLGTEAGLSLAQVMGFSVVVIAGAAQFTAVSLMQDQAPVLVILATSLAVNLRMAMYSAALVPHLGDRPFWQRGLIAYVLVDQVYGMSSGKYEENPDWSSAQKMAYYLGIAVAVCPLWYLFTYVGAVAGTTIPESWGLDFALPICFLAMIGPMLRTAAHMAAAFVSILGALALAWVPFNLGLIIAAILAMAAGVLVERALLRRADV